MTDVSAKNFGYLIAYVIPGFVVVAAAGLQSDMIRSWLSPSPTGAPTVGGFLYVTLASVAAGMVVSALRWLLLDMVHQATGVPRQLWDVSVLSTRKPAFEVFVEYHYRHYQFYGNLLVALTLTMPAWLYLPLFQENYLLSVAGISAGAVLLFLASRDTFRKYNTRTNQLLNTISPKKEFTMTNGCGSDRNHDQFKTPKKEKSDKKRPLRLPKSPTSRRVLKRQNSQNLPQ